MEVTNAVYPPHEQFQAFFATIDVSPFVMVNLLKFKDVAEPGVGHTQVLDLSHAMIDRWIQARFAGGAVIDSCARPSLGISRVN